MSQLAHDRTVAIMQPYFFPYIGYFQLVYAADTFVFYDDVTYIKGGWINRNRLLINRKPSYITVSLRGASQNRLIRDIELVDNRAQLLRTIELAYRKAPFFEETMEPVAQVLTCPVKHIGELAMHSITAITDHLGLSRDYRVSGNDFDHTKTLHRADRLIAITQECGSAHYVNAIGGRELYDKAYFGERGVTLDFLKPVIHEYKQFGGTFQPALSIVDVLMFNPVEVVARMLSTPSEQSTMSAGGPKA